MAHLRPVVLVFLLAFSALADDDLKPMAKPIPSSSSAPPPPPTPPPPSPVPTEKTTAAPITIEPITKPPTKPTATPAPTKPPTTKPPPTPPPTTTPSTTTTTTTAKPTSPAPPSTTTAAPPTPDPKKGTWSANFANTNVTCILVQAAIQIEIPYLDGNATKMVKVNVPEDASATGTCQDKPDGKQSSLHLEWSKVANGTSDDVTLEFAKNGSSFDLDKVAVTVNVSIPGAGFKVYQLVHVRNEFSTPVAKSYKCAKEQTLNLTAAASNETTGYLRISQVQLQAFHNATGTNFAQAMDCAGSGTPDVVPIAVGCALATLVVIVLVAYLVGRRRSQARGYLSMFVENKREEDYIPMKNLSCFN